MEKSIGGHRVFSKRVGVLADYETRSPVDIKIHGASVYANDIRTEIMCLCVADVYRRADNLGFVVDRTSKRLWRFDEDAELADFLCRPDEILFAFNASFEFLITTKTANLPLTTDQMYCLQCVALYNGLPSSLDAVSKAMPLQSPKDDEGHRLMLEMCKPNKKTGSYPYSEEKMERLCEYCIQDIEAEAELLEKLIPLPEEELAYYRETLAINMDGIPVDMELVRAAKEMNTTISAELQGVFPDINMRSHAQIKTFTLKHGYILESTNKEAVANALADPKLPDPVRMLLDIKALGVGSSSVSKFDALVNFTDTDGKLRNAYRHHGAIRTGRWTSQGVQIQNLPRGEKDQLKAIDQIRDAVRARDIDALYMASGMRPMDALRTIIRTLFSAPKGYTFVQRDLSAIEARGALWVSQAKNLKIFTEFDNGVGKEPYMIFADLLSVDRFLGKTTVLSSGYGCGAATFQKMIAGMGVKIDEGMATKCLDTYKDMFPEVKEMWYKLDKAAKAAIETPGIVTAVETPSNPVKFKHDGQHLRMMIPSGRVLTYWGCELQPGAYGKEITYMTFGAEGGKAMGWHRTRTWGGGIMGCMTQGFCACIMRHILTEMRKAGIPSNMTVHDEAVTMVEEARAMEAMNKLTEIMNNPPDWAVGMPIQSAGWVGNFYRKD